MDRVDGRGRDAPGVRESAANRIRHQLNRPPCNTEVVFVLEHLGLTDQNGGSWIDRHPSNSIEWNAVHDQSDSWS